MDQQNFNPEFNQQNFNNSGKGQGVGLGIASMVLGIVSIVLSCVWYVCVPAGVVSIILAIVQMIKNEKKGMAIAGIICSVIGIILAIVMVLGAVALLSSGAFADAMKEAGYSY